MKKGGPGRPLKSGQRPYVAVAHISRRLLPRAALGLTGGGLGIDCRHLHGGQFLGLLQRNGATLGLVHLFLHLAGLVVRHACASRNQATDDDVFLQATQLVTSAKVDTETVYQITKAMFSDSTQKTLAAGHAKGKFITKENAVRCAGIPFHPGAERVYKEAGLLS